MRKLSLFTIALPTLALVMSSCNNNAKTVNYISIGDAIAFAEEHHDPHIHDGYNVTYTFDSKDSKATDVIVYKKHYYDPTQTGGDYYLEKAYSADLNLQNIVSTLYYKQTLSFGSADLLAFHQAIAFIRHTIGYIDCGFTRTGDHLGYYISSEHLEAFAGILGEILEIASYVLIDSRVVQILTYALNSFTANEGMCVADIQFTRFGFLDTVDLTLAVNDAWFDFTNAGEILPDTFYGDYMSVNDGSIHLSLTCNYSL
ncbi:MAG: hypothetical protein MJ214_03375 [Bacilli bacterium]|nr:hypothetical protein [Bacilli bacterium]